VTPVPGVGIVHYVQCAPFGCPVPAGAGLVTRPTTDSWRRPDDTGRAGGGCPASQATLLRATRS
jgi:hypothetical protein